jgi:hypothetical protein
LTTGENVTGVRDEHYDLVSILYPALQGAETYDTYISDAEVVGDQELTQGAPTSTEFRELKPAGAVVVTAVVPGS